MSKMKKMAQNKQENKYCRMATIQDFDNNRGYQCPGVMVAIMSMGGMLVD